MSLKNRLTTLLDELGYDFRTFTTEGFIHHVERLKARKILFTDWDLPPGLFGLWITDTIQPLEYIFIAQDLPPILRTHVQLHEIGHILCGHPTLKYDGTTAITDLLPLFRSNLYTNSMELEAETLAALVQTRVFRYSLGHELSISVSSRPDTAEFLKAMGLV
ncbi:MAG: hypothetical protein HUU38_11725 [Anaerolineales bacterium]|nr:hypothetical protein [Anaerolineales bacterium]